MENASLIVSIVRRGWGSTVLAASVKAGARGGTVLFGRGAGINEQERIFGVSIEPEKEIVLTVAWSDLVDTILREIVKAADYSIAGQVWTQAKAVGLTILWSGVVAFVSYKVVDLLIGLRVTEEDEREGLDITSHGESAYRM